MKSIGNSDVESYIRNLVSEEFGKHFRNAENVSKTPDDKERIAPSCKQNKMNDYQKPPNFSEE